MEQCTLGGGCFWCLEAVYQRQKGVTSVVSGYAGGPTENPTYREVCGGQTGHAEVVQITYDPAQINFKTILELFWRCHDPTTLNRQGADVGTQYRSIILYHDQVQKEMAEQSISDASVFFNDPIVTEVAALTRFYPAEQEHHNYYNQHSSQPYCTYVIRPKLENLGL